MAFTIEGPGGEGSGSLFIPKSDNRNIICCSNAQQKKEHNEKMLLSKQPGGNHFSGVRSQEHPTGEDA
jgi:hypothetical protein